MRHLIVLISLSFLYFSTFGWGQIGHRVVAEIAKNHLSDQAKRSIQELLEGESFIEASNWMDDIKSDALYNHTHAWHYMNIEAHQKYEDIKRTARGDIYEATQRMISTLKDRSTNEIQKREALIMLIHLVGDFHQPLHVGLIADKGGNSIKIKWFNKASNLHRIWDSEMINSKQYSYTELAKIIENSSPQPPASFYSIDLDDWVQEAIELRSDIYSFGEAKSLSYPYLYNNWDIVKKQLHKAGLRLATLLNEIYE